MPRGLAEGLVHGQEAAVAVDQREADRKHVEQRLQVRRLRREPALRRRRTSRKVPVAALPVGIGRHVHRAQRRRGSRRRQRDASVDPRRSRRDRRSALLRRSPVATERALAEQAVGGEEPCPCRRRPRPSRPPSARRSPVSPAIALDRAGQRVGGEGSGKAPQQELAVRPTRSTSTGLVPACVAIPATQPAPSRQAMDLASCRPWRASSSLRRARAAAACRRSVRDRRLLTISSEPFAGGQRCRLAAEPQRRPDQRIIRADDQRLARRERRAAASR